MKLYKSILFGLLMCGFTACDTTDLERDINSLKDRVEDYEAQVQKLNDDMNIIRVLLDGNKTITSYSFDGTNYTLTLSNGETLTLTQGVVGANYPSITIDEESGNWIIAGKDSGVKAEAEDGKDAPYTPQFKIENENWWVSYDGGVTWTDLGEKATGDPSGESSLISNVTLASDGNSITIKLSDNKSYTIPVVKDLVCEITEPELADGEMWYIGSTGATLKVKVNIQSGDIIRPVVPADWKAEITEQNEGELKVKVTPLAYASKCVVTIEVNRGANTITDEIVARTQTTSYYADYMAGLDIEIDGLTINKTTFKEATLVESNVNIVDEAPYGLYFVKPGAILTYAVTNSKSSKHLIVIGDDVNDNTACFKLSQRIQTNMTSSPTNIDGYYVWSNIKFDASELNSATFVAYLNGGQDKRIIFDNCDMILPAKNFFELHGDGKYFNDLSLKNSRIKLAGNMYLVSLDKNTSTDFGKLTIENNIFYTNSVNEKVSGFKVINSSDKATSLASLRTFVLKQNTFINVTPTWSGMYYTLKLDNVELVNNLFWYGAALVANGIVLRPGNTPSSVISTNNLGFSLSNSDDYKWIAAFGGINKWNPSAEDIVNLFGESLADDNNPFNGGEMHFDTGQFIPNAEYSMYGAQQN
mgnify:FL=1|jgi:hypothetical protein